MIKRQMPINISDDEFGNNECPILYSEDIMIFMILFYVIFVTLFLRTAKRYYHLSFLLLAALYVVDPTL